MTFAHIIGEYVAMVTAQAKEIEALKAELERQRHIANEWADMATNGIQWVRNIVAGITPPEYVVQELLSDLRHCQEVSAATTQQNKETP